MTHVELITSLTHRVRHAGAAVALDELRSARPAIASPSGVARYNDTLAVFYVWAVDRLVAAGLDDVRVMWHPLTDVRSPRSWWTDETLESDEAAARFVPSTLARAGEPAPQAIQVLVAA
jgi:aryl carrier-like protein